jgi:hypothetical protein
MLGCAPCYFHYAGWSTMSESCRMRRSAACEAESLAALMTMCVDSWFHPFSIWKTLGERIRQNPLNSRAN